MLCFSPQVGWAQKGKKGGGGDSEPPAPRYAVNLFSHPADGVEFNTLQPFINQKSQVAGCYLALRADESRYTKCFFYDPAVHGNQAVDLQAVVQGLPQGYILRQVWNMNDNGLVLVTVSPYETYHPAYVPPSNPNYEMLAGIVDTANGFQYYPLPNLGRNQVTPRGLNNAGDVTFRARDTVTGVADYHVASKNPNTNVWELNPHSFAEISLRGISDRLKGGDLFVIGSRSNADGVSVPLKINIGNPGVGEVELNPIQINKDQALQFWAPSQENINRFGEFVALLNTYTERTRKGVTTTSNWLETYLLTEQWEAYEWTYRPNGLNDQQDFLAEDNAEKTMLFHRDRGAPVDLLSAADPTTAPEIQWDDPNLRLRGFDLANRVVTEDGDLTNDMPVIVGFEYYLTDDPFAPVVGKAFILTPINE